MTKLTVNGVEHTIDVEPETPLLWVIRDTLGLTGTKFGCGVGACGACVALVEGAPMLTCQLTIGENEGADIVTIEGLSKDRSHPVQRAWIAEQVPQCGYCQSGMILAAAALLKNKPKPTDSEIDDAMTNICRCGTYSRIRAAIHRAAEAGQ
jgi:aerobic-type carbon monoxide dehydrogenase small subunit (CoxS/CutS family)